jgi:uncharacterized protein YegL
VIGNKVGYDEFGNPVGKAFDLGGVDDERLRGEKILLYVAYVPGKALQLLGEKYEWHHAQQAVAERNLHMDILIAPMHRRCSLDKELLSNYSQLWYVSDKTPTLNKKQVQMITGYVGDGNGLLIWADNKPYYADANLLANNLIGTNFSGNKYGDGILVLGERLRPGCFIEHSLTQGVNRLYEGITISTIAPAQDLTILAQSHDGQMCMACFERDNQRIVLDTGFTKLVKGAFYKTAGTARYFRNIAFWLAKGSRGLQYTLFTPGRESLATINPGGTSERYRYTVAQPTTLTYVLHWEGAATLGLVVQDPQGRTAHDSASATAPIRVDVPANVTGGWVCWVKGVNVPRPNFPYVLTLVLRKGAATVAPPSATTSPQPSVAVPPVAPVAAMVSKQLPMYLVVDGSKRMSDLAPHLDLGLRRMADRLRSRVSRGAGAAVGLIVADDAGRVAMPLTDVSRFIAPGLTGRGTCGLGRALSNLLASLLSQPTEGKPLVVMLLAGPPDDAWTGPADQLRNLAAQGKANVFVIGVGGYADATVLKRLTPMRPLALPVVTQDYTRQVFDWLYGVADVVLSGLESGASGQRKDVPAPPACLHGIT